MYYSTYVMFFLLRYQKVKSQGFFWAHCKLKTLMMERMELCSTLCQVKDL